MIIARVNVLVPDTSRMKAVKSLMEHPQITIIPAMCPLPLKGRPQIVDHEKVHHERLVTQLLQAKGKVVAYEAATTDESYLHANALLNSAAISSTLLCFRCGPTGRVSRWWQNSRATGQICSPYSLR